MKREIIAIICPVCISLLFAAPARLSAQQSAGQNHDLVIEKQYNPVLEDANKIEALPAIEKFVPTNHLLTFGRKARALSPLGGYTPIEAAVPNMPQPAEEPRGIAHLRVGYPLSLEGDLCYNILSQEEQTLSFTLSNYSTFLNQMRLSQSGAMTTVQRYDTKLGVDYMRQIKGYEITSSLLYQSRVFNYYGYDSIAVPSLLPSFENRLQSLHFLDATVGVTKDYDNGISFYTDLTYQLTAADHSPYATIGGISEHTVAIDAGIAAVTKGRDYAGLEMSIIGNFYPKHDRPDLFDPHLFKSHALLKLNPYYKFHLHQVTMKAGAVLDFAINRDQRVWGGIFNPALELEVEYNPIDSVSLFLKLGGGMEQENYRSSFETNRYMNPMRMAQNGYVPFDIKIGAETNILPNFRAGLSLGYRLKLNDLFFINESDSTLVGGAYRYNQYNYFKPIEQHSGKLYIAVDLGYNLKQYLDIRVSAKRNFWFIQPAEGAYIPAMAWERADWELGVRLESRPTRYLSLHLAYDMAIGGYAYDVAYGVHNGGAIPYYDERVRGTADLHDLSFGAQYYINKMFSVSLTGSNLLGADTELYYGYPVEKFNVMAGLSIRF